MYETAEDLRLLQHLLDESHKAGGPHLRGILQDDRRLSAQKLSEILVGVQILSLATVSRDCAPLVGGVDGLFYRGRWHFGSAPNSVRARHLSRNPAVSAAHLRGEEIAVIVHGTATPVDVFAPDPPPFRSYLMEVYPGWEKWYSEGEAVYWRIEPKRMLAAALPSAT